MERRIESAIPAQSPLPPKPISRQARDPSTHPQICSLTPGDSGRNRADISRAMIPPALAATRRGNSARRGFTLVELLIVVTIIGITVALSSFSVTVFDDFKITEKANAILDEIVQCREEAIFLGSVCVVHIENERTKRDITETLLGLRVRIGGVEYNHPVIPFQYKLAEPDEDTDFEILAYRRTSDSELDLTYERNVDPTGEKDPLLKQGVISFYPDASYSAFILKVDMQDADRIIYLHGDGTDLPEISAENPLLTY